jgi:DNA-binding NarL/FixJ family response regulator
MEPITVLIADDDPLVRRALTVFLSAADGISVLGEASNGAEAIDSARRLHPDVALVDIQMPGLDGIDATAGIALQPSSTKVIAITTFGTLNAIMPMLRAGASGYLLKDTEPEDIVAAVRDVHAGVNVLSPRVTAKLIDSVRSSALPSVELLRGHEMLSTRENEVVQQLALGLSNAEIAAVMHVSEGTVKAHLGSIIMKWGVRDRVQVLIRAVRAGLVTLN